VKGAASPGPWSGAKRILANRAALVDANVPR
jgi:hypothetical protein